MYLKINASIMFISDWRQLIHVAAIDCAEERNLAICVHYNILGYPTVKVSPLLWLTLTQFACYHLVGKLEN